MAQQQRDMEESGELLTWLMSRIKEWRDYRDDNHKANWDKYYRIWRGIWSDTDRIRDSERSRLISPATQQAVEATVAELEEATFGRDTWFDIVDDPADQDQTDIEHLRIQLKDDLNYTKTKKKICEALLNGTLYGTGIGEIIVEEMVEYKPEDRLIPDTTVMARGVTGQDRIAIKLNPVSPYNFSSDPAVADVDDCLGCEITEIVPKHIVEAGIKAGNYLDVELPEAEDQHTTLTGETKAVPMSDKVKLTRYYGKVPKKLLADFNSDGESAKEEENESEENDDLVEAIVVIVNDSEILKAQESPYMMKDRPIVAYQHDTVPGRFWGRGIPEKGYNPQVALDTELRARADGLALTTHPMMAIDATRLPRGMKPKVAPGMTLLTNGNPKEILMPMNFGTMNPVSYKESSELERMVTMGTGAMDMSALNMSAGQPQGQSMLLGASIKRQKRTLMNFQESFLIPFIRKAAFRFMQFDPERYPAKDMKFCPTSTMGLMAREFEQQQMTTMLGYIPPESPVAALLVKGIVANSSMQNREDLLSALDDAVKQMAAKAQDNSAQQAQMGQLKIQSDQNDIQKARLQFDMQKFSQEFPLEQLQASLDERKVAVLEQTSEVEAAKLALSEADMHLKHEEAMANVAVKQQNNMQDNQTNAENATLAAMKLAHRDLESKVTEITAKVGDPTKIMPMKKKITVIRDKSGNISGAHIEEAA